MHRKKFFVAYDFWAKASSFPCFSRLYAQTLRGQREKKPETNKLLVVVLLAIVYAVFVVYNFFGYIFRFSFVIFVSIVLTSCGFYLLCCSRRCCCLDSRMLVHCCLWSLQLTKFHLIFFSFGHALASSCVSSSSIQWPIAALDGNYEWGLCKNIYA